MRGFIERLEDRRLLSAASAVVSGAWLIVRGGSTASNTIVVSAADSGGQVNVTLNGTVKQFNSSAFKFLRIIGGGAVVNDITSGLRLPTRVDGGRLVDTIRVPDMAATVFGGAGNDTVIAAPSDRGAGGGGGGGSTLGVLFRGGPGDDTLTGGNGNDKLFGEAGNDTINTGLGRTYVDAGTGNDTVHLGNGTCFARLGAGNDSVTGGNGGNDIRCGPGNDVVTIGSDTSIAGDTVRGETGNDSITGGAGDDHFNGGAGDDTLRGNGGNDELGASRGLHDVLDGGTGSNKLFGGLSHLATMTCSPRSDSDRNTYETNSKSVIDPAARKGIDRVYRLILKSEDSIFGGGLFPF